MLVSTLGYSQTNTEVKMSERVTKEIAVLQKADLNLSDMQLSRITIVLNSLDENYTKTMKTFEGNKSVQSQRLAEIQVQKVNNIKGVLTPSQLEKFNALKLESQF